MRDVCVPLLFHWTEYTANEKTTEMSTLKIGFVCGGATINKFVCAFCVVSLRSRFSQLSRCETAVPTLRQCKCVLCECLHCRAQQNTACIDIHRWHHIVEYYASEHTLTHTNTHGHTSAWTIFLSFVAFGCTFVGFFSKFCLWIWGDRRVVYGCFEILEQRAKRHLQQIFLNTMFFFFLFHKYCEGWEGLTARVYAVFNV